MGLKEKSTWSKCALATDSVTKIPRKSLSINVYLQLSADKINLKFLILF